MQNRNCYWSKLYIKSYGFVLSDVNYAKYVNIDDLSNERKQKAWIYINDNNKPLAKLMLTKEFKEFKTEAQSIFNAKQVIKIK